MLVNILKIMLNGRKKKTNKNKNEWSENLKTDPKCSSDNNISMENGTTIQDLGHSAQLSKSTENFSMSTLYKENINDELNDSTERTEVEEGKIIFFLPLSIIFKIFTSICANFNLSDDFSLFKEPVCSSTLC
jgi:hypothetical protein